MSKEAIVAKRYAKALFEVAHEKQLVGQVEQELAAIAQAVEDSREFRNLVAHPSVPAETKIKLFQDALNGKVSDVVLNTIRLLFERGREALLSDLTRFYQDISYEATGRAKAVVYSAHTLSEPELAQIAHTFGRISGKQMEITNVTDSSLLGGIRVRIGDRLYDGSLATKLAKLEKTLAM